MDLTARYHKSFHDLYVLSNELEKQYGRYIPGSPLYVDILEDMMARGIKDDRIQPTLEIYKGIMFEMSQEPDILSSLR